MRLAVRVVLLADQGHSLCRLLHLSEACVLGLVVKGVRVDLSPWARASDCLRGLGLFFLAHNKDYEASAHYA